MTTYTNAKIFTGTGPEDFASAFTVTDGRFSWVGDAADAPDADAVDLAGATVLPGLLDVHTHPAFMAILADATVLLQPVVVTKQQMIDTLATHPNAGRGPDDWITGFGYNEDKYPDGGPTRHDLDRISTTQPVFAHRADGHNAVCNSVALKLAGVTRDTPDPEGARFGRDADGEPDGRLIEVGAVNAVYECKPAPGRDEIIRRLVAMNERFGKFGIVAVDDLYGDFIEEPYQTFLDAHAAGFLPQVAVFLVYGKADLPTLTDDERTGHVHVAGVKMFMDGAFSSRTAWVEQPYPNSDDHGIVTISDEDLRAGVRWARENKVQAAIHVMGDRGINHLIEMFGDEEPWLEDRPSIRFDHSSIFTADMLQRVADARMNFGLISHSIFFFGEYDSYLENLNPDVWPYAYPLKTMYAMAPAFAIASDSPATAWAECDNVMTSVYAAVARKSYNGGDINADEAVTVPQALELYTGRAAAVTTNRDCGTIEVGRPAHFVIMDRDVFEVDHEQLLDARVAETWMNGERVYGG